MSALSFSAGIRIINKFLFKYGLNYIADSMMDYSVPERQGRNFSFFWLKNNKMPVFSCFIGLVF